MTFNLWRGVYQKGRWFTLSTMNEKTYSNNVRRSSLKSLNRDDSDLKMKKDK